MSKIIWVYEACNDAFTGRKIKYDVTCNNYLNDECWHEYLLLHVSLLHDLCNAVSSVRIKKRVKILSGALMLPVLSDFYWSNAPFEITEKQLLATFECIDKMLVILLEIAAITEFEYWYLINWFWNNANLFFDVHKNSIMFVLFLFISVLWLKNSFVSSGSTTRFMSNMHSPKTCSSIDSIFESFGNSIFWYQTSHCLTFEQFFTEIAN